jgi:hypothetical protein
MTIRINGNQTDITLESEKTVGEVLAGLNDWLTGSGHRLSGLNIDGETAASGSLETFFYRELAGIGTLDISTSSLPELTVEALIYTRGDLEDYENADFGEKKSLRSRWMESPGALFLAEQAPEIYQWAEKTFSGEGLNPAELRGLIDERLRELEDPREELEHSGPLIAGIAARLEDLPLDIQTGKDGRAVETVQMFSNIAEKIFRVFRVLKAEGLDTEALKVDDIPIANYIEEFDAALRELLAAYETRDIVLVGDLAEYELAPRLRGLYAALSSFTASPA